MTIQDLISVVLSKIKLIILFTIVGGVAAFCFADFVMPLKYSTYVRLYVKSSTNTSTDINTTQIDTAKALAETYIVILSEKDVYERISDKFSEDYDINDLKPYVPTVTDKTTGELKVSPSYIKGCISISVVDDTEILNISATTEMPEIAADMCTYMAEIAPDILMKTAKAGVVEAINEPDVPESPVSPNVPKLTVMGAMAGMIGCAAVVILLSFFNNKVTTGNDLKERLEVAILAEIPTFDTKSTKGAYK